MALATLSQRHRHLSLGLAFAHCFLASFSTHDLLCLFLYTRECLGIVISEAFICDGAQSDLSGPHRHAPAGNRYGTPHLMLVLCF